VSPRRELKRCASCRDWVWEPARVVSVRSFQKSTSASAETSLEADGGGGRPSVVMGKSNLFCKIVGRGV